MALSTAWKYGREHYDLPENPCRLVKSLHESNGRIRWLIDAEKKALLKACKTSDWPLLNLLVTMAITSGARLGGLLHFKSVQNKSSRHRLLQSSRYIRGSTGP